MPRTRKFLNRPVFRPAGLTAATRTYLENPSSPPWRKLERASGDLHLIFGALYALALWATVGR